MKSPLAHAPLDAGLKDTITALLFSPARPVRVYTAHWAGDLAAVFANGSQRDIVHTHAPGALDGVVDALREAPASYLVASSRFVELARPTPITDPAFAVDVVASDSLDWSNDRKRLFFASKVG